jgi:serine/threonine protein kinase
MSETPTQRRERKKRERRERKERKERDKAEKLSRMMQKRHEEERELYEPRQLQERGYKLDNLGELGVGRYCVVYKIRRKDLHTNVEQDVASKLIELDKVNDELFKDRQLPRELLIVRQLATRHDCLVHFWDVFETSKRVYVMMECMSGGPLWDYLQNNLNVEESQIRSWIFSLGRGINYLHTNGIAHRGIRLENILMDKHNGKVKLAGFSNARLIIDPNTRKMSYSETNCGGGPYAPLEVLRGDRYDPKGMDIWTLGVCIFYAMNRRYPFDYKDVWIQFDQQTKQLWRSRWKDKTKVDVIDMVGKMMIEPKQRANVQELLNHKWLQIPENTPAIRVENEDIKESLLKAFFDRLDILQSNISSVVSSHIE